MHTHSDKVNRLYPGKQETMVLDFANDAEEIQTAFEPYYEKTLPLMLERSAQSNEESRDD